MGEFLEQWLCVDVAEVAGFAGGDLELFGVGGEMSPSLDGKELGVVPGQNGDGEASVGVGGAAAERSPGVDPGAGQWKTVGPDQSASEGGKGFEADLEVLPGRLRRGDDDGFTEMVGVVAEEKFALLAHLESDGVEDRAVPAVEGGG